MQKLIVLASLLVSGLVFGQGMLSTGNTQTFSGATFTSQGTGNVVLSLPTNGNSNTGVLSFASAPVGSSSTLCTLGYNTGTAYLTANNCGFLISGGQQLNIAATGATRSIELQQTASNVAIDLQISGSQICLANGTDCVSDSSGLALWSASVTVNGTLTVNSGFQSVAGPSYSVLSTGTTAPANGDFGCNGAKTCVVMAASGQNLNIVTTSGGSVQQNGTPVGGDWFWTIFDQNTVVGTTGDIMISGPTKTAATLQDVNYTVPVAGGGTGNLTTKLSSAASGGGTVFATCTIACNAAANTLGTCTINTAAVPAATTLHYGITAACTTADVQNIVTFHGSNP